MRIAIVDDILERHVAASLASALRARGHAVLVTGKLSHGPSPTRDHGEQALLLGAQRSIERFEADVALLMRPQSWPVEFSTLMRQRGVKVVAWLSDDPVLYASGYGHVVESADIVLHCGGAAVIDHYDRLGLSSPGVNFPFWTADRTPPDFARHAGRRGMFLGHLRGQVRTHRLALLESLEPPPIVYGQLDDGVESAVWGGELRSMTEISRAAVDATVGLNLPQQFADYRGSDLNFPGLGALHGFETPSRVVQYASLGLAVLTLDPAGASASPSAFQAQVVTETPQAFRARYSEFDDRIAIDLGVEAWREFNAHFTADRRAALLEALLLDENWRSGSAVERSVLYRGFDDVRGGPTRRRRALSKRSIPPRRSPLRRIALLGKGWADPDSHLNAARAALDAAGVSVLELNPYAIADRLVPDPKADFAALLDVARADPVLRADALVIVGADIGLTGAMWAAVAANSVAVGVTHDDSGWQSARRSRLAARAQVAITVKKDVAEHAARLDMPGRLRARIGAVRGTSRLSAKSTVMAATVDGSSFCGFESLALEGRVEVGGATLERVVIAPALAATPGATLRLLRRLRRHDIALSIPVEVLAQLDIEVGPCDQTYAGHEELQRKLQNPALSSAERTAPTSMNQVLPKIDSTQDLATLLATID